MQTKKLDKMLKNIENAFSTQNRTPKKESLNKSLIKKAQNLIKNGPKNLQNTNRENSFNKKSSRPAPQLKVDTHLNKSLNKSQETNILSSITKHSNQNISVIH